MMNRQQGTELPQPYSHTLSPLFFGPCLPFLGDLQVVNRIPAPGLSQQPGQFRPQLPSSRQMMSNINPSSMSRAAGVGNGRMTGQLHSTNAPPFPFFAPDNVVQQLLAQRPHHGATRRQVMPFASLFPDNPRNLSSILDKSIYL